MPPEWAMCPTLSPIMIGPLIRLSVVVGATYTSGQFVCPAKTIHPLSAPASFSFSIRPLALSSSSVCSIQTTVKLNGLVVVFFLGSCHNIVDQEKLPVPHEPVSFQILLWEMQIWSLADQWPKKLYIRPNFVHIVKRTSAHGLFPPAPALYTSWQSPLN